MRNRLLLTSMDDAMAGRDGSVTRQKIEWFRRKAQGGIGWIQTGYLYVTPRGRGATWFQGGIDRDELVPGLAELVSAVREHDVRIGAQLVHAGRQTKSAYLDGLPPEGPSAVPDAVLGETPVAMTVERISEVVDAFAAAAGRAQAAGFDLVEIHGAHGYLHHSFFSPTSNHREDEYGGSLENRARFSVDTVRAVREAVGEDFVLGYRISADEFREDGFTLEEALRVVPMLEDAGISYINVSAATYESSGMMVAPMFIGPGQLEHLAAAVRKIASVPVVTCGRYNTPELAERALAAGSADFVALGRALVADPDFPAKAQAGRSADIRPCVACNQACLDRWTSGLDIGCVGNPEAGRESLAGWATIERRRPSGESTLVIGGGPAGLEAARTAALLGNEVELWERAGALGGQLALAAEADPSSDWARLIQWFERQLRDLGVAVRLGREAGAEDVVAATADHLVIATGARSVPPLWPAGSQGPKVIDAFAALAPTAEIGRRVVVVGGTTIDCRVALSLAGRGHEVTIVAGGHSRLEDPDDADLAYDVVGPVVRAHLLEELGERVTTVTRRRVKRITADGVVLDLAGTASPHLGEVRVGDVDESVVGADTVVAGERVPERGLYDAVNSSGAIVSVVGDALTPCTVAEATATGAEAVRRHAGLFVVGA
ncbi:MAG: FAD-dependent oxidoreductase [Actinobacteria bacterium]|nr:FAD-dependent oxidoreductase [Actinomycetota bacterium]